MEIWEESHGAVCAVYGGNKSSGLNMEYDGVFKLEGNASDAD